MGLKLPTTPLALGATGAAAGAAVAGAPAIAAGVAGLGTLYGLYKGAKWLPTAEGKHWLTQVIRHIEEDPLLSGKLKTDRLMFINMLNEMEGEEDE